MMFIKNFQKGDLVWYIDAPPMGIASVESGTIVERDLTSVFDGKPRYKVKTSYHNNTYLPISRLEEDLLSTKEEANSRAFQRGIGLV